MKDDNVPHLRAISSCISYPSTSDDHRHWPEGLERSIWSQTPSPDDRADFPFCRPREASPIEIDKSTNMALTSSYNARNPLSFSSRGPSIRSRPRSVSMADYAPLDLDREALSSAYQAAINPSSSMASSLSSYPTYKTTSSGYDYDTPGLSSTSSAQQHSFETAPTSMATAGSTSTLSHHLRPGDNPHAAALAAMNQAGVGAGHSLSPPGSPFHSTTNIVGNGNGNGLPPGVNGMNGPSPASQLSPVGPPPPPRPGHRDPETGEPLRKPSWMRRGYSSSDLHDSQPDNMGYERAPEGNWARRRDLPPVPTNVPQPVSHQFPLHASHPSLQQCLLQSPNPVLML